MTGSPEGGDLSAFTSTVGGVMTEEAGAITGDLELLLRPGADGTPILVRYAGAEEWYTVSGGPVRVPGGADDALDLIVRHLTTPRPVEGGNERPVTLEGFPAA